MEVLSEPVLQITKDPQESWARCLLADLCDAVTDGDVKAWVALDPRTSLNLVFDEIPSMELVVTTANPSNSASARPRVAKPTFTKFAMRFRTFSTTATCAL